MAITDILSAVQGGRYFANAGAAAGLAEAEAHTAISGFAPKIAAKLKDRAASDPEAFDALLDLLEDGGDSSDLDDVEAMTGAEALSDGAAILVDLYGSKAAAEKALGVDGGAQAKAAALSATAVLATLAASSAQTLSGDAQAAQGGGLLSIIFAALMKGLLQGAQRQLAPRRRRRRRYTYSTRRRTTTARRRTRTRRPGLDDLFKDILVGRR